MGEVVECVLGVVQYFIADFAASDWQPMVLHNRIGVHVDDTHFQIHDEVVDEHWILGE